MIPVSSEPVAVIGLDLGAPACIDLSGGLILFVEALMAERITEMRALGIGDDPFRQLRGNKDHAAVSAEYNIARNCRRVANMRRPIDADHGRVEACAGCQRTEVMRWIVEAHEGREVGQLG
jgi:hypothetical protein